MKVSYKGVHHNLPPKVQEKLDAKFAKLSKLLEHRGEREAHVILTHERHLNNAEITLQFYDHKLVAIGSDSDIFAAMSEALVKLEKQAVKHSSKFRDKVRRGAPDKAGEAAPVSGRPAGRTLPERAPAKSKAKQSVEKYAANDGAGRDGAERDQRGPRIFRVDHHDRRKPITVEEAVLHMEDGRDYMVYRDADKECISVLVRRRDGHFDLVEV